MEVILITEVLVTYYVSKYDQKLRRDYIISINDETGEIVVTNARWKNIIYRGFDFTNAKERIHKDFVGEFGNVNLPPNRIGKRRRNLTELWQQSGRPSEKEFWEILVNRAGGNFVFDNIEEAERTQTEIAEAITTVEEEASLVDRYRTELQIINKYRNVAFNNLPNIILDLESQGIKDPFELLDILERNDLTTGKARITLTEDARKLL